MSERTYYTVQRPSGRCLMVCERSIKMALAAASRRDKTLAFLRDEFRNTDGDNSAHLKRLGYRIRKVEQIVPEPEAMTTLSDPTARIAALEARIEALKALYDFLHSDDLGPDYDERLCKLEAAAGRNDDGTWKP